MKIQAVIGANYGDEGKGLVSGCLAREAAKHSEKTLTVFYNGTSQRAHTFEGEIHRCMAAGTKYGSDTFYHKNFVVDPISVWILQAKPIIDGRCRVIVPCDVNYNRFIETRRGNQRHGSCGFGLFEAVKRSKNPIHCITVADLIDPWTLYQRLDFLGHEYDHFDGDLYNLHNFMLAADYIRKNCRIAYFEEIVGSYDTVIFEGGQGLLLDQDNKDCFPHLTPSSTGIKKIADDIKHIVNREPTELFYVTRSYMTRHGNGPMESECVKEDINRSITDSTNTENEFQGMLRFGEIDTDTLKRRIWNDANNLNFKKVNLVVTQLNYTDGKISSTEGMKEIPAEGFDNVYLSDQRDYMERK